MNKNLIDARIKYSNLVKKSKDMAKRKECLWCGKQITNFCNSHSVPRCILNNIDSEGKVDYFNALINIPILNKNKGLKEAGTFRLICKECDGTIFQDYESLQALLERPTERMLEEIALKNNLTMLNKRYYETEFYRTLKNEYGEKFGYKYRQNINKLDEKDFWYDFERCKLMMESEDDKYGHYNLFFWRRLEYVIPIAFQGIVTLYGDLEGNIVSDIYSDNEKIVINHIHICLFPLENKSVVFAFYHCHDSEFDAFSEQFSKLDENEKLRMISYLVLEYNEDFFFAPKFPHRTWMLKKIKSTFLQTTSILALSGQQVEFQKKKQLSRLKEISSEFPCILDEKYSVDRLKN